MNKSSEQLKGLRGKSLAELRTELLRLRKEQFTHRMQQAAGQFGQTHLIREARRAIAQVKTVMTEKSTNV